MKTRRRKRQPVTEETSVMPATTIFSSDLLTPEEERELLADFWETKSELVRALIRSFSRLRQHRPALEPWPMAQFIRDHCTEETGHIAAVRRLHDRYVHLKHRLASANIRLAAHVAKHFRHHALSYADLLQEAVCGLMQAIDRFDVSHGTRLATYATWWIRQTLQIAVARQSHLVSLSPHHLQELGLLQQESGDPGAWRQALAKPAGVGGSHRQQSGSPDPPADSHAHPGVAECCPGRRQRLQVDRGDAGQRQHHAADELGAPGGPALPDGEPAAGSARSSICASA